jgi:hypothetical protein
MSDELKNTFDVDIPCPACNHQMAIGTRGKRTYWRCMARACLHEVETDVRVTAPDREPTTEEA